MKPRALTNLELTNFLAENADWEPEAKGIARSYAFKDFAAAMAFAVQIACIAQKEDHHPDLSVSWGKVRVFWSTHDTGGLSDFDLRLATASDAAYAG